ncbi:MAG: CgeB family protein [Desulfonauticus sp. 38_4375]|nr:MAG: CgeB family protein [Desulfonauticus sp. 38_4375]
MPRYKVLVVLPFYGGSYPIGKFAAEGLRELGHLVEVFDSGLFYSSLQNLKQLRINSTRLEQLEQGFIQVVSEAIWAKIEEFEPGFVLALAQAPLTRQVLLRLKKENIPSVMWFVEDFRLFTYWRSFAPLYDVFAVIQQEPFFSALNNIGVSNHLYLPLACLPSFHRPLDLNIVDKKRYGSELSFMGAGYPNRRKAFKELVEYDLKIWGTEWEGEPLLEPFVQEGGRRVSSEEVVKIFNASKINLNLHSSLQDQELVSKGDFVNPRTFEIAGCGCFQLVDRRELLPALFSEEEVITFESLEDLKEKINYFLPREEERHEIATRARARALREHTYAHRMQTLVSFLEKKVSLKPLDELKLETSSLPEEVRLEIERFLREKGLKVDSSLADIIHTIKQGQGELTPIEAAFLFLEEWKKQYLGPKK